MRGYPEGFRRGEKARRSSSSNFPGTADASSEREEPYDQDIVQHLIDNSEKLQPGDAK